MSIKNRIWNPMAFFISLFMSLLMPLIVAVPFGNMSLYTLFSQWVIRWIIAYFTVNLVVIPVSLRLAQHFFTFPPHGKLWNPVAFFISLCESFIMPFILAYVFGGMSLSILIFGWPFRWVVAYLLVTALVMPLSIKLAEYFFNFEFPGRVQSPESS
ncbi:hypothetical protein [Methanobrevibacter sp. UBA412]|uniref:hypothetical protein n=2 Tax=unclassified Methanobrevibacter TaxID=2638681 RepID=UPI002A133AA3|nr:hypothetical protein [Methanobacteriaceae archaeon]MDD4594257.1 hypothetical protein [Methanobacteriaceae archaeon]